MDTQTGRIYTAEEMKEMAAIWNGFNKPTAGVDKLKSRYQEMSIPPTAAQMRRRPPRIGRNEPCPCGSGRKFKKCCLRVPEIDGEKE